MLTPDSEWFCPGEDDVEGDTPIKWASNAEDEVNARQVRVMTDEGGEVYVNRTDLIHFMRSAIKLSFAETVVSYGMEGPQAAMVLGMTILPQAALATNVCTFTDTTHEKAKDRCIPVADTSRVPDFVPEDFLKE